jgi:hypothetical protein
MALAANLVRAGRQRRYVLGGIGLAAGAALAAALVLSGAPLGARFLVFVPFVFGALGVFQAHAGT